MKYTIKVSILLFMLVLATGCSNDSTPECFKNAGKAISYEVDVPHFTTIRVSMGIELVLLQGAERKVTVKTRANLTENISAKVVNSELVLTNNTGCNWVRDYKSTTIYVTTPHLEKIYSASQFSVRSGNTLSFKDLSLQSGIFNETASGTFELEVNCTNLTIDDNQAAYYAITGFAENVSVNFYSGDARFDGSNLAIKNLKVFHRSSNDIIASVQQQVTGTLYSTGNLVLKNHPPVVTVERLYSGKVIYK